MSPDTDPIASAIYWAGFIVVVLFVLIPAMGAVFNTRRSRNRVYESVTHLHLTPYSIRVWREESDLGMGSNEDLRQWAYFMNRSGGAGDYNAEALMKAIEEFPRVVAVEVTCGDASALLYPNWN